MLFIIAHNCVSIWLSYMMVSYLEYGTHRWMLHNNTLVKAFPHSRNCKVRLEDHAVSHHSKYYKCFRRENDPHGKHVGMLIPPSFYLYTFAIVGTPMVWLDWITALWFAVFLLAHYRVWNDFHEIMHDEEVHPWYLSIPGVGWWFRKVEYYHFMHHQHRSKNFNAFLPAWDWLLSTLATETALDREVWRLVNEGEFVDRKGRPMPSTGNEGGGDASSAPS